MSQSITGERFRRRRGRSRRARGSVLAALALAAAAALGGPPVRAQAERPLGLLEQESVDESLAELGLKVEPNPAGKVVGTIYVVNREVFSRRDWRFQMLNFFHRTTRPQILSRELLIKPGQLYDEALVEESTRNLQSPPPLVLAAGTQVIPPELSSVVAIVPVVSPLPGTVDLLAVTRDIWSLRFNTNFEFQQNTLSQLDTSLSENNLFGWRKYLALGFSMDLGKYALGPAYLDPNIAGTRLTLYAHAVAYYTRGTNDYEGNSETVSLHYPLYSLASRWGAGVDVAHANAVTRHFLGTDLAEEPLMAMPGVTVPYIYRRSYVIVDVNATRSFGLTVIRRATLGYLLDARRSALLENFPYGALTPAQLQTFLAEYAPITEQRSGPYLQYDMFTAWYGIYRDLDTFDLRENERLGPSVSLRAGLSAPALGADFLTYPLSGTIGWAAGPAGAFFRASITGSTRLRAGTAIDQIFQGKLYLASPLWRRLFRLVLAGEADAARADTQRTIFFLGGDSGLRGYAIGDLQGTSMVIAHAELRSAPLAVRSQRIGALLFYDIGDAAPSFGSMRIRSDTGIGLRWLIPQLNSSVLRVDWAVPLENGTVTPAGFPGRATAGFQQIF